MSEGRWTSPDPAGMGAVSPGDPQTWNRYSYVENNLLSATDPLGLFRSDIFPYAYAKWGYSWITSLFFDGSGHVINPFGLDPGFPTDDTVGVVAPGSGGGGVGGGNNSPEPANNEVPQNPCNYAGRNLDPSAWAAMGQNTKNNPLTTTYDFAKGFAIGGYLDAHR